MWFLRYTSVQTDRQTDRKGAIITLASDTMLHLSDSNLIKTKDLSAGQEEEDKTRHGFYYVAA